MKRMSWLQLLVGCLGWCCAGAAFAATVWEVATGYPETSYHTRNLQQMADEVATATGGKLTLRLHPGGSLVGTAEIKRAVQSGQVQAGEILISNYQNESRLFGADSVPFLASDAFQARKLWAAQSRVMGRMLAKQGMKQLYAVPWPPQGLFSGKPVNGLADLKGMRMRTYNEATERLAVLLGAQGLKVQVADLPQALADGKVDGYLSSGTSGADIQVWRFMKHFYTVDGWMPKNLVLVNQHAFDALDAPTQVALLRAAGEAEERGWRLADAQTRAGLDALRKHGVQVAPPSPALRSALVGMGDRMIAEWQTQAGEPGQELWRLYRR